MKKAIICYFLVTLFLIYEVALQISPSPLSQLLIKDLDINAVQLSIISSAYFYTYMTMQIPSGVALDRYGYKPVVLASLLFCFVGTLLFSQASTMLSATAARMLIGFGSASAFLALLYAARLYFSKKYFGFLSGLTLMIAGIGGMIGQYPVAYLARGDDWRFAFVVFAVAGIFIFLVCVPGLGREKINHGAEQTVNFRNQCIPLLKNRQLLLIALFAFLNCIPLTVFAGLWGPAYLVKAFSISNLHASAACLYIWLGYAIMAPVVGYISDRIKRRCVLLSVMALAGIIATSILAFFSASLSMHGLYACLFLLGFSCSAQALTFSLVRDNTPASHTATASGLNNLAVVSAPIIGQPLVSYLIHSHSTSTDYTLFDYQFGLSLLPVVAAMSLLLSLFLIKETRSQLVYDHGLFLPGIVR